MWPNELLVVLGLMVMLMSTAAYCALVWWC